MTTCEKIHFINKDEVFSPSYNLSGSEVFYEVKRAYKEGNGNQEAELLNSAPSPGISSLISDGFVSKRFQVFLRFNSPRGSFPSCSIGVS